MKNIQKLAITTCLSLISLTLFCIGFASAAAPLISQSYTTIGSVHNGSLVSIVPGQSNEVEPANSANASYLLGAIVGNNQSIIEINPSNSTVQVASSGILDVLVSNINGNISPGDYITPSPFNGVGMKAGQGVKILGQATSSFNGNSSNVTTVAVTDKNGHSEQIKLGYVRVAIVVGNNGQSASVNELQKLVKNINGKTIPVYRVVIAIAVAFVAIITMITLIYTAIYGTIVATGRNPLAKAEVIKTLVSVIGMTVLIGAVSTGFIALLIY